MSAGDGCAAPVGGASLAGVDVANQSVIQGTVVRGSEPVSGAYVRLLDSSGEFAAEVPTGAAGEFRFFAAPGAWTVRALAAKSEPAAATVQAEKGSVAEVTLALA